MEKTIGETPSLKNKAKCLTKNGCVYKIQMLFIFTSGSVSVSSDSASPHLPLSLTNSSVKCCGLILCSAAAVGLRGRAASARTHAGVPACEGRVSAPISYLSARWLLVGIFTVNYYCKTLLLNNGIILLFNIFSQFKHYSWK